MSKSKTHYVCQQCGRTAAKPLGRCPQCGEWNSMVAELLPSEMEVKAPHFSETSQAVPISQVKYSLHDRIQLGMTEFSRVLGGGIVPASVVLIGGDPGIGKSTLLLQMALIAAEQGQVLYVSGEESPPQIRARAERLHVDNGFPEGLFLYSENNLLSVFAQAAHLTPRLLIVDSIQTIQDPDLDSPAGSISQVRNCTYRLQEFAKSSGTAVFIVGHVTKEGSIAGPKVMEHIVDTVLYLEGDGYHTYRLLRSMKNRFGATTEVGVFEMASNGMQEVPNPSETFLAERMLDAPGSAIAVTLEGTRPLLVEVQGLTTRTTFGNPRRTANGVDLNRLLLTVAVLARRAGVNLMDQDVFVNVVGGLRISEPAADLAMASALASSLRDRPIPSDMALIGEVGLSGELRTVPQIPIRLKEVEKLGFRRVVIPTSSSQSSGDGRRLEIHTARSLREAIDLIFA